MKMKLEHYETLKSCMHAARRNDQRLDQALTELELCPGVSLERIRWDWFWSTMIEGRTAGRWYHDNLGYLNDNHIDTALKRIYQEQTGADMKPDFFYTHHTRCDHQAFTKSSLPCAITESYPTEIELVEALKHQGISIEDYNGKSLGPAMGNWFDNKILWSLKQ